MGGLGSAGVVIEKVWWIGLGHDEVRPAIKCNTSDHPSWGQVKRYHLWPLRMGASANTAEQVRFHSFTISCCQKYDAGILSFHISRQWACYSHYINIHIHFWHSFSLIFHLSSLKTMTTQFHMDWILFGLWGCKVLSFTTLKGVCWIISSMGTSTVKSWLVSTIDSCAVVFVWLLTCLQGTSTTLAKHESTFVDYILLGLINSNTFKSSCVSTAPVATFDASDSIWNGFVWSGINSTGSSVNCHFKMSNASWHLMVHSNFLSFFVKSWRGLARLE